MEQPTHPPVVSYKLTLYISYRHDWPREESDQNSHGGLRRVRSKYPLSAPSVANVLMRDLGIDHNNENSHQYP